MSGSSLSNFNILKFNQDSLEAKKDENVDNAEEPVTSDSEEYVSESLRYKHFFNKPPPIETNVTLLARNMSISGESDNIYPNSDSINGNVIEIPIVGYEIMEERARFTVYKLKVENKVTGDFWYVFRRYTDFVRLCNGFKSSHPSLVQYLPKKRWLKNNFDPVFLEERVSGLQTLVNAILNIPELVSSKYIQDFFCLNEPPLYSETSEESKAIFEALEETIADLKQQLHEKDVSVDTLQSKLHSVLIENDNLRRIITSSMAKCQKCQKDCENFTKLLK